jgi:hypothetical protein
MDILISGKVNFPAQPVHAIPGFDMFIIPPLVTHMRINQEDAGKGNGKSKDAQNGI